MIVVASPDVAADSADVNVESRHVKVAASLRLGYSWRPSPVSNDLIVIALVRVTNIFC